MNLVFPVLALLAVATAAWSEVQGGGRMAALSQVLVEQAQASVTLAFGLLGIMALFLGLMKVAEAGGLLVATARLIEPLLRRLFPEVPPGHPAMGAMVMNVAANLLGLGNAATPFGIRAMEHLGRLNRRPGTASDAMVLFLVLNTAGFTLLPTKVIALRASAGSADPAAIVVPTLVATLVAALLAWVATRLLQRVWDPDPPALGPLSAPPDADGASAPPPVGRGGWLGLLGLAAGLGGLAVLGGRAGAWLLPLMVAAVMLFGLWRRVPVYERFVEGARDALRVAVRILPYLVAILVVIGMVRASGAMEAVLGPVGRVTAMVGLPAEALLMAVTRSLSGSGAFGLLASQMNDPANGPDSRLGILLGTLYGSTETTFYVLAVYFGAVGVRRIRHALAVGLFADIVATAAAVAACAVLYPDGVAR